MKQRFYRYRRGEASYLQDSRTGKPQSLETKDRKAALRLLEIKRQTAADPGFNQFIHKSCLTTQDPLPAKRTWRNIMDQMQTHGKDSTKARCARAMKSRAFDGLRHVKLVETSVEDFLSILNCGKVSVVHHLKRLHNLALGFGWLAFPVLAPRLWPKPRFKSKRGITLAEHLHIGKVPPRNSIAPRGSKWSRSCNPAPAGLQTRRRIFGSSPVATSVILPNEGRLLV